MYHSNTSPREPKTFASSSSLVTAYDTPTPPRMHSSFPDIDTDHFYSHMDSHTDACTDTDTDTDAALAGKDQAYGHGIGGPTGSTGDRSRTHARSDSLRLLLEDFNVDVDVDVDVGSAEAQSMLDEQASRAAAAAAAVSANGRREGGDASDEVTTIIIPASGTYAPTHIRPYAGGLRWTDVPGAISRTGAPLATDRIAATATTPGPTILTPSTSSAATPLPFSGPVPSPRADSLPPASLAAAAAVAGASGAATAPMSNVGKEKKKQKKIKQQQLLQQKKQGIQSSSSNRIYPHRRSNINHRLLNHPSPTSAAATSITPWTSTTTTTTSTTTTASASNNDLSPPTRSETPTVFTISSPTTIPTDATNDTLLVFSPPALDVAAAAAAQRPASTGPIRTPRLSRHTRRGTDPRLPSPSRRSLTAHLPIPSSSSSSSSSSATYSLPSLLALLRDTIRMDYATWPTSMTSSRSALFDGLVTTNNQPIDSFLPDQILGLQSSEEDRRMASSTGYPSGQTALGLHSASFDPLSAATPVSPVAATLRRSNLVDGLQNGDEDSQHQQQQQLLHRRPTHHPLHSQSSVQIAYDHSAALASFPSLDPYSAALIGMSSAQQQPHQHPRYQQQQQQQHHQQPQHAQQLGAVVAPYFHQPSPPLTATMQPTQMQGMNGSMVHRSSPNMQRRRGSLAAHHPYHPPQSLPPTTMTARSPYPGGPYHIDEQGIHRTPFEAAASFESAATAANEKDFYGYLSQQMIDPITVMTMMQNAASNPMMATGPYMTSPPYAPSSPSEEQLSEDQRTGLSPLLPSTSRRPQLHPHQHQQSLHSVPTRSRSHSQPRHHATMSSATVSHRNSTGATATNNINQLAPSPPQLGSYAHPSSYSPLITPTAISPLPTTIAATGAAAAPSTTTGRFPGQRVDSDIVLISSSFLGSDEASRKRKAILDGILRSKWYHDHSLEPKIRSRADPIPALVSGTMNNNHHHHDGSSYSVDSTGSHVLSAMTIGNVGTVGRSIYTAFLEEDRAAGKWRCLFGGGHEACPKATKSFERVERAIEHIRRHLGHRPYPCTDTCPKSGASGAPCGQRFFASQYLQDHIRRPATRARRAQSIRQ